MIAINIHSSWGYNQEMQHMFASIVRNHDLTSKNSCVKAGSYPELQPCKHVQKWERTNQS